jgi:hypothetical protein
MAVVFEGGHVLVRRMDMYVQENDPVLYCF